MSDTEQTTEKIILAMGLENGPSGLHETPRRAFDDEETAHEFLEYEEYGGRVMHIELERQRETKGEQHE